MSFYFNKEIPTLNKTLSAVNDDPDLPDFKRTTMFHLLKNLEFEFKKRNRNSGLQKKEEIVLWWRRYLQQIMKYRMEGKPIYYLDETWVNAGHTKQNVWQDTSISSAKDAFLKGLSTGLKYPSGKGKHLIVEHIGDEKEFVNNGLWVFESRSMKEYHEEMNGNAFQEWFEKILPSLEPNYVIVIDNASYHSVKKERIPTTANNKDEIKNWLTSKGIPVESDSLKAELLDLVRKNKAPHNKYIVDEMAQEQGKLVLRLPPYYCELIPIEFIWSQVKGYVARNNKTFTLKEVTQLLHDGVQRITSEAWAICVRHVVEKKIRVSGVLMT
ncbi:hypothetical protein C0J52_24176 [Blattella germanica]|nr:hypothetical protein C0J52_24176 [Blattella germanica]